MKLTPGEYNESDGNKGGYFYKCETNHKLGNLSSIISLVTIFKCQMKGTALTDSRPVEFPGCYAMTKAKRGRVLILNDFFGRMGSELDVENLENLFQQFHFEVVCLINLSSSLFKKRANTGLSSHLDLNLDLHIRRQGR